MQALRKESPLGSTDIENVLRTAASKFDKNHLDNRVLFYIGDGMSSANLLGTDSFRSLVGDLSKARTPVSSYAIGPQIDGRLLAALANQTGGMLYIAEQMTKANDAEKITAERANEENLRRSENVGAEMANWAHATVFWPTSCTWPTELGQVYPKIADTASFRPRFDRDWHACRSFDQSRSKSTRNSSPKENQLNCTGLLHRKTAAPPTPIFRKSSARQKPMTESRFPPSVRPPSPKPGGSPKQASMA